LDEGVAVARDLILELQKSENEAKKRQRQINEVAAEIREFARSDLVSLAEHIRKKSKMSIPESRDFLHEMLDVSV